MSDLPEWIETALTRRPESLRNFMTVASYKANVETLALHLIAVRAELAMRPMPGWMADEILTRVVARMLDDMDRQAVEFRTRVQVAQEALMRRPITEADLSPTPGDLK